MSQKDLFPGLEELSLFNIPELITPHLTNPQTDDPMKELIGNGRDIMIKAQVLEKLFQKVNEFHDNCTKEGQQIQVKIDRARARIAEKNRRLQADFQNYLAITYIDKPNYDEIIKNYALTVQQIIKTLEQRHYYEPIEMELKSIEAHS